MTYPTMHIREDGTFTLFQNTDTSTRPFRSRCYQRVLGKMELSHCFRTLTQVLGLLGAGVIRECTSTLYPILVPLQPSLYTYITLHLF